MSSDELARTKKKYVAIMRAKRRLQSRLDDIDWEYDVLLPSLSKIELEATEKLQLPQFTIVDED